MEATVELVGEGDGPLYPAFPALCSAPLGNALKCRTCDVQVVDAVQLEAAINTSPTAQRRIVIVRSPLLALPAPQSLYVSGDSTPIAVLVADEFAIMSQAGWSTLLASIHTPLLCGIDVRSASRKIYLFTFTPSPCSPETPLYYWC